MKQMLYFCFVALLLTACGKESSDVVVADDTFLKFKLDDKIIEYPDYVFATRSKIDNQFVITIRGQKDLSSNVPSLGIFIQDTTDILSQAYVDHGLATGSALLYSDSSSLNFSSLYIAEQSDLKIEIKKLDSTSISGTFSSKVADLNANTKAITEGEFSARFQ